MFFGNSEVDLYHVVAALFTFGTVRAALKVGLQDVPNGGVLYTCDSASVLRPDAPWWERLWITRKVFGLFFDIAFSPCGDAYRRYMDAARTVCGSRFTVAMYRIGPKCEVLVGSPEDAKFILVEGEAHFRKSPLVEFIKPVLGESGLITVTDRNEHAVQRKAVSPAFIPSHIDAMNDRVIGPCLLTMLQELRTHSFSELVLSEVIDVVALKIVSRATFDSDAFESVYPLVQQMQVEPSVWMALGPRIYNQLPTRLSRLFRQFRSAMATLTEQVVSARRQRNGGEAEDRPENTRMLVDVLLENHSLSSTAIRDHAATFIFAGHDTTASALTWFSFLMATHPDIQEQLLEELRPVLALGGMASMDALRVVPLLHACVNETLRLYPPIAGMARETVEDCVLPMSKVRLPKGTGVIIPHHVVHRDERVWGPRPDEFIPSRWLNGACDDAEVLTQACAYLPFGAGARSCIGKRFATAELTMGCAMLVRNFSLGWPAGQHRPKPVIGVVMKPSTAFRTLIETRRD